MRDYHKPSYNDAMAEWSAKRSIFRSSANRLFHPDPFSPLPLRIYGYLWRLAVVSVVFFLGWFFLLSKQIKSPKFSKGVALNFAEVLQASEEDLDYAGIRWSGSTGRSRHFIAKGSENAFYHDIEMRSIEFQASRLALFTSKWKFKSIAIDELRVKLRSGGKVEIEDKSNASHFPVDPLRLAAAGFILPEPDLANAKFDRIKVNNANFFWGRSPSTIGSLTEAELEFIPGDDDQHWRLDFKGGKIDQNWWKDVVVRTLTVRREPGKLIFENGQLQLGEGAEGFLSGEIATGAIPRFDLRMEFADMPAGFVIPRQFASYLDNVLLAGTNRIQGSVNLRSGVEHHLDIKVQSGTIDDFPALDAIALLTEHTPFRRFPITSGSLTGQSRGGVFTVDKLELISKELGLITGKIDIQDPAAKALVDALPGFEAARKDSDSMPAATGAASFNVRGDLLLGAHAGVIDKPVSPIVEKYLPEVRDNHHWMTLTLDGQLAPLMNDLMQGVRRDLAKE